MRAHTIVIAILAVLGSTAVFGKPVSDSGTNGAAWIERILNSDGTINWTEYENVALHAGELTVRDYLLGPKYEHYIRSRKSFRHWPCKAMRMGGKDRLITSSIWLEAARRWKRLVCTSGPAGLCRR